MSTTEINLTSQTMDGTLTPSKVTTNPSFNFAFPNNVSIGSSGQLLAPTIADLSSLVAMNVTSRQLLDTSSVIALDFLNRLLKASDGSTSLTFATPGTILLSTILDMGGNT